MEEEEKIEGEIEGIFYSEFHNKLGPKIYYQFPSKLISNEVFDSISDFVITKSELCHRVIIIRLPEEKKRRLIGYSVYITHRKYLRNALRYNVGFILSNEVADIEPYRVVVRKLAETLRILEEESEFLYNEQKKKIIFESFPRIIRDLNQYRYCSFPIDEMNSFHLILRNKFNNQGKKEVNLSSVPLPLRSIIFNQLDNFEYQNKFWDEVNEIDKWGVELDMGIVKVIKSIKENELKLLRNPPSSLPSLLNTPTNNNNSNNNINNNLNNNNTNNSYNNSSSFNSLSLINNYLINNNLNNLNNINNINNENDDWKNEILSLRIISKEKHLHPNVVKSAAQFLLSRNLITLISPFDYKDTYIITPKIHQLANNVNIHQYCVDYVKLDKSDEMYYRIQNDQSNNNLIDKKVVKREEKMNEEPTFHLIFSFYCKLRGEKDYLSFLQENNLSSHSIHECRFIIFGLANNFIRSCSIIPTLN